MKKLLRILGEVFGLVIAVIGIFVKAIRDALNV
jgi:hypothetical protein